MDSMRLIKLWFVAHDHHQRTKKYFQKGTDNFRIIHIYEPQLHPISYYLFHGTHQNYDRFRNNVLNDISLFENEDTE